MVLKVTGNLKPVWWTSEFQMPDGCPGVPDVVLWKLESHSHSTSSPGSTVTSAGVKKSPDVPILTVNFLAMDVSALSNRMAPISPKKRESDFIIWIQSLTLPSIVCQDHHAKVTRLLLFECLEPQRELRRKSAVDVVGNKVAPRQTVLQFQLGMGRESIANDGVDP